jgi:glucose-6-phosphate 1-dehydrogenase
MSTIAHNGKIDTIVVIGCGDLTQNRLLPALKRLAGKHLLRRAVLVDLLPRRSRRRQQRNNVVCVYPG